MHRSRLLVDFRMPLVPASGLVDCVRCRVHVRWHVGQMWLKLWSMWLVAASGPAPHEAR